MKTVLNFAGLTVGVEHNFSHFENKTEYSAEGTPDFCVSVSFDDIKKEREITKNQCRVSGTPYYDFPDAVFESTAVYRKIADKLYKYGGFVFHGSAVAVSGKAYIFTAPSGTGKTTHTNLWLKNIKDSFVVNGDKPIIRIFSDGRVYACGTPWAGKEDMGVNKSVPLEAICFIKRAEKNTIRPMSFAEAVPGLIGQIYRSSDKTVLSETMSILDKVGKKIKFYELCCNMEDEAALVSFGGMCRD